MKLGWIVVVLASFLALSFHGMASETAVFNVEQDSLHIQGDGSALEISLRSPRLLFRGIEGYVGGAAPVSVSGDLSAGEPMILTYASQAVGDSAEVEVRVSLGWTPEEGVLRKQASVNVLKASAPVFLDEVVLEVLDAQHVTEDPRPRRPAVRPCSCRASSPGSSSPWRPRA